MKQIRLPRPGTLVVLTFLVTVLAGTLLLCLPIARSGAPAEEIYNYVNPAFPSTTHSGTLQETMPANPEPDKTTNMPAKLPAFGPALPQGAPLSVALFTAASATSVTGLIVVDTATYWSGFGQAVILMLIELGGIGTMTVVSLVAMALRQRITSQGREIISASVGGAPWGELRRVLLTIISFSTIVQLSFVFILWLHFWLINFANSPLKQIWHAFFLVGSAFNNAGFAPYSDSLMNFASDAWTMIPLSILIILGGLGFPVYVVLSTHKTDLRRWDMTTRIVLLVTPILIIVGTLLLGALEWNNPATLGSQDTGTKLLGSFFAAVSPRTAGFNAMDVAGQLPETWVVTEVLMLIGGGPAGTAGGIKITTALVITATLWAEIRGSEAVNILGLRLARSAQRHSLAVFALFGGLILINTFLMMLATPYNLNQCLYEVTSALSTVGLSTGITPTLNVPLQAMLICLMLVGRLGPLTVVGAIGARKHPIRFELPRDYPLIG